jgi:hypothetical protein
MSAEELEREFAGRAVPYRGGLMLLQADDALALVRRAEEGHVPILGVDGIIVSPQGTTAPLEHIADYPNSDAGNWSAARRFVEQRRDAGLVFEITLG